MNLLTSLRTEYLKTRGTASFYLTLVAAAVVPAILLIDLAVDGVKPTDAKVIFNKMFSMGFQMTSFLIFPMFVVLICTLLPQIEFKNNAWKQVLASPQLKSHIYLAKFVNIHFLILLFLVANLLLTLVVAVIFHLMQPALHVLSQPLDKTAILKAVGNSYLALLALCAIQFYLGLRFKNFIVPMAVGIACWVIGSILVMALDSSVAPYFPYSFHVYSSFSELKPKLPTVQWTSLAYAVLVLTLGFWDFNRRGVSK